MPDLPYAIRTRDEHFANDGSPKRILALDGGGLRGVVTLAFLAKLENTLRERHGNSRDFRLCHYFDLISGTSTGAIIAAALAKGWTVERIRKTYFSLGNAVFEKSLLRKGLIRAKYSERKLNKSLKEALGENTTLGSAALKTGLLIVTKRVDSGSPWPISNNPRGKYYNDRPSGSIGNSRYPLWQVVRASTAAPVFFDPEKITIIRKKGSKTMDGEFVDGGVSPFNNPALQSLMFATVDGYRVGWPTGADRLLVVSIGTGRRDPSIGPGSIAALKGVKSLVGLMDDSAVLQETMMQWLSTSPTAREIDRELGDLGHDLLTREPAMTYVRYNLDMREENILELDPEFDPKAIEGLSAMDAPENMEPLFALAQKQAAVSMDPSHIPHHFDLD